jgi:hypothetical protein
MRGKENTKNTELTGRMRKGAMGMTLIGVAMRGVR